MEQFDPCLFTEPVPEFKYLQWWQSRWSVQIGRGFFIACQATHAFFVVGYLARTWYAYCPLSKSCYNRSYYSESILSPTTNIMFSTFTKGAASAVTHREPAHVKVCAGFVFSFCSWFLEVIDGFFAFCPSRRFCPLRDRKTEEKSRCSSIEMNCTCSFCDPLFLNGSQRFSRVFAALASALWITWL